MHLATTLAINCNFPAGTLRRRVQLPRASRQPTAGGRIPHDSPTSRDSQPRRRVDASVAEFFAFAAKCRQYSPPLLTISTAAFASAAFLFRARNRVDIRRVYGEITVFGYCFEAFLRRWYRVSFDRPSWKRHAGYPYACVLSLFVFTFTPVSIIYWSVGISLISRISKSTLFSGFILFSHYCESEPFVVLKRDGAASLRDRR